MLGHGSTQERSSMVTQGVRHPNNYVVYCDDPYVHIEEAQRQTLKL